MSYDKISVVLATYNGEKYIFEQIQSILCDLDVDDEIIVSDDGSTDNTLQIVEEFNDNRIRVVSGPKQGFVKNFENAVKYVKNDYIFFSDQDDIWIKGKKNIVMNCFKNENINLVKHDAIVVDSFLNHKIESYNEHLKASTSFWKNVISNKFTGCCMACRKTWLNKHLPTPDRIYHDWWLGLNACKEKTALIIDDKLLLYRRHGDNVSSMKRNSLFKIIRARLYILKMLRKARRIRNA